MEKLSEPFDHEEYNILWRDITEERLKERHFHLRSGVVKSGKKHGVPGPSYLDQYPGKLNTTLKPVLQLVLQLTSDLFHEPIWSLDLFLG